MSADGNVKFAFTPLSKMFGKKPSASVSVRQQFERICAVCDMPVAGRPPVLLKSGDSVHLECYLLVRKRSASKRWN